MENLDPWLTLLGVLIGGLLGGGGLIIRDHLTFRRERKSLAVAIGAEIRAVIETAEMRDYEAHFRAYLENWKQGKGIDSHPTIVGLRTMEDARTDQVFDTNIDKLGLLGSDVAAEVVRFYGILKGIKVDLVEISNEPRIASRIKLLEEDLELWQMAKQLGKGLQDRLGRV